MLQNLVLVTGALVLANPNPGILVIGGHDAPDERVLRLLVGHIAAEGVETFLATDMARPPPDARRNFEATVRNLTDARSFADQKNCAQAVQRYDAVIDDFQTNATTLSDLDVLRVALIERADCARTLGDSATAETAFLRALVWDPEWTPKSSRLSAESKKLLDAVRAVVRRRPRGKLIVDTLPSAVLRIDFVRTANPGEPIELTAGSHFVSVSVPGRAEMIVLITVPADYETRRTLRPPLTGSRAQRARVLDDFDPEAPDALADLSSQSGLQFIALVDDGEVSVFDARGALMTTDAVEIASSPTSAALQVAAQRVVSVAAAVSPTLRAKPETESHWYTSWWGVTLMAAAVAGVAFGTAFVATRPGETEFIFVP